MSAAKRAGPKGSRVASLFSLRSTTWSQKLSLIAGGASTGGAFAVGNEASQPMLIGGIAILIGFLVARLIRWFVGWLVTVSVAVVAVYLALSGLDWLPQGWNPDQVVTAVGAWWNEATDGFGEAARELLPGSGGGGVGLFAGLERSKAGGDDG